MSIGTHHLQLHTGPSRDDVRIGLTATAERALQDRAFDVAAAMLGVPGRDHAGAPDAAEALMLQGIVLDFVTRHLPGPGCRLLSEDLRLSMVPAPGDTVRVTGTVTSRPAEDSAVIALVVEAPRGRVAEGAVTVRLPAEPVTLPPADRPDIILHHHRHLEALMERAAAAPSLSVAVAWPCDRDSLLGPLQALRGGAILPILVGPRAAMEHAAAEAGASLDGCEVVEAGTPHEAAMAAVRLCRDGRAAALMKGSLHTDELMAAVVSREGGLRGTRRLSHVFAMDVASYHKPLFITDAAINIAPDLATKVDIVQNAVDTVRALGEKAPKVAILSAVETVNPKIPGTLEAAALCKMADRGQITGAILDGPLAFDNAISRAAAAVKKITSPVAGDADILVAPDLEAGNMIAKQLSYLAGADSAGLVLGARVPVILTSRADSVTSRLASIALARMLAAAAERGGGHA
ncbi:bifunctional enoyl-CoA hydratase/phosphate acetyltransferase [Sabulicella rubraurantiaca]|uniref:bifunctional enoyl-CoA hydratase/phosphate acetyltransferase n=1 Tax=Sabulicella rubraurantiaca TaxID=2811429 RepID=UPI001A958710|nr:bifunctional enoyl-CoA hydratase/phosphate acetyltransferase [Sabulicella rubraurantiaca]